MKQRETDHRAWWSGARTVAALATLACLGSAAVQASVDLHLQVPLRRPLLIDVTRDIDCPLKITVGGDTFRRSGRESEQWRLVDTHTVRTKDDEQCTRAILKACVHVDGSIADPELVGATFSFRRSRKDWTVSAPGNRAFTPESLARMSYQAASIGLWLDLPQRAVVGKELAVDLAPLLRLLLNGSAKEPVERIAAALRLETLDAASSTAVLAGPVECTRSTPSPGGDFVGTCSLVARIELDLKDRRVKSARFAGKIKTVVTGGFEGGGEGTIEVALATETGSSVATALAEKPQVRGVTHRVNALGLEITLPSYYFDGGSSEGVQSFKRGLDADKGSVVLSCSEYPGRFDAKALAAELKKGDADCSVSECTGALGSGLFFSSNKGTLGVLGEIDPLDDKRSLLVRIESSPALASVALADFNEARRTLKRMK